MEFLLFTLTVGSFLMVFPYLSEGSQITIQIPSYMSVGSELKVTCSYSGNQIIDIELLHGDTKSSAVFAVEKGIFESESNIQFNSGSTIKSGSVTFIFSQVTCKDFSWYMCKTKDRLDLIESNNQTLQVLPRVDEILTNPAIAAIAVHEVSTFTCEGTMRKEGPYSVEWYRTAITSTNRLTNQTNKVLNENTCSRTISSTLTYNVSEYDTPNLLLWCQITSGKSFAKNASFSVQELTTIAASVTPQPVKAGLDPGSIVGIVLGVTALIVLVVLLVWFLVIRPKRLKADGPSKDKGPEPNAKDYQVQENVLYATVDPLKKHNYKSSSSSLDIPDTNSNSVQDTGTAARNQKPNKQNAFLPSHGDATDNMDEAYELPPPPPPPPPKPHRSPRIEPSNPLHYAELELAVQKSAKRRSEYGQRPNTDYAVISHS